MSARWSARYPADDPRRRDHLFLGHIRFSFAGVGGWVSFTGELEGSCRDLDNL